MAAAQILAGVLKSGGKILLFGNGGSAADAQHLAAEFVNRLMVERPALAALALTTLPRSSRRRPTTTTYCETLIYWSRKSKARQASTPATTGRRGSRGGYPKNYL